MALLVFPVVLVENATAVAQRRLDPLFDGAGSSTFLRARGGAGVGALVDQGEQLDPVLPQTSSDFGEGGGAPCQRVARPMRLP